jgi:thiol-disulfide isomerase/thioredoxin
VNVRFLTLGLVAALALAACGGGAAPDASASPTISAPAPSPSISRPASPGDGVSGDGDVTPTIAPDVPEALLAGVGPMAVIGDGLPPFPETGEDPAIGMRAPVLVGETFGGEPVRVDASVDGPTWVIFLAHWCPHCNDEIPVINQLRDDGRIPEGLNVVGISTAYTPDRPNWPPGEWLVDKGWTYTAVPDGIDTVVGAYIGASAFGIGGFPFSVLLDGDGTVVARWAGERDAEALVSLLTENLPLG